MSEIRTHLFLSIDKYTALTPNTVSNVGELSKRSLSYSKDINTVSIDDEVSAYVFYTKNIDDTNTPSARSLDNDDKGHIRSVLSFYYSEIEASTSVVPVPTLLGKFAQVFPAITDVTFKSVITSTANKKYYGYFSFAFIVSGIKRYYNVWCADSVFQSDYPVTEYVVVPVYSNLENFWVTPSAVISDLEGKDPYEHAERVQGAIGDHPPTGVLWLDYPYLDPVNASITTPVKWAVIYYGASASSDSVKAALVSFLTSTNSHTAAQWKTIFPDIFSSTKFIFYPLWSDYAIPNMQVGQSGVFKNGFKIKSLLSKVPTYFSDYDQVAIDEHLHYMPMPYKSIGVLSMPGQDNPASRMSIDAVYTDIINITSVSADFNRMTFKTQGFLNLLSQCLTVGETFSTTTNLPSKLYRVTRNNKTFIAFTYRGIEFIVAPKNAL